MPKKQELENTENLLFSAYIEVSMKKDAKGSIVPYVSKQFPENSTKSLPGDLPFFITPDYNEIKPLSVYEPQEYTVVLTGDNGERLYGFCRRYLPEGIGGRYDVGERLPQVICYVTRRPYFTIFSHLVKITQTMTRLEPEKVLDFVDECRKTTLPEPGEKFYIGEYEFIRPRDMDAPLIDVKLAPLVSRFDVKSLINLLSSLMCEKRIIFIGDNLTVLSECIHAAVAILCPFSWHHIFIPIVPASLLSYVTAPMPFLVGIKRTLQPALDKLPMEACVYVDVDNGTIAYDERDPIIDLYPKNAVPTGSMGGVGKSVSTLEKKMGVDMSSVRSTISVLSRAGHKARETLQGVDPVDFLVRALNYAKQIAVGRAVLEEDRLFYSFLSFFVSVFGCYNQFFTTSTEKETKGELVFDRVAYLDNFAKHVKGPLNDVLKEFPHSQMFERFIERRLQVETKVLSPRDLQEGLFEKLCVMTDGTFSPTVVKDKVNKIKEGLTKEASRYRNLVIEITSNNSSRINVPKTLHTLATATFSSETCGEILDTLWWRCNDSAAGNWKHGLKALQALAYLLVNGSERVVSETIQNIHNVLPFVEYENKSLNSQRIQQMQLFGQRTYRLLVETMRLQRERARVAEKRGSMKHSGEMTEDETPEGENVSIILGNENVETTKMRSLDLSKAFDEDFAAIHSALRPSTDILDASLSSTLASTVSTDIFASKIGSSSTHMKGKKKLLDPTAILGGDGMPVLQTQKSVSSLSADEPEEKPKKKVVRKVVKKVVKKKAPTEEAEEPAEVGDSVAPEELEEAEKPMEEEEKPKKKVVRKVVKKVVKKKAPEPEPEEDLLGGFEEKPKEEPEEDLMDGFDEPEEKPKKKVVRKVVKKVVKKKVPEPEPEEDLLGGFGDAPVAEPEEDLLGFNTAPAQEPEPEPEEDLLGGFEEVPVEKPKKKIVKKVVKKKAPEPEPEEDLLVDFGEAPVEEKPKKKVVKKAPEPEPEEDLLGDFGEAPVEEKPKKKVVKKVVKKKAPEPEPEPEEDLLGDFDESPAQPEHHPEDDLLNGFDDFDIHHFDESPDMEDDFEEEEKPKKKVVKKVVKKKEPEPEEDFLNF